MKARLATSMSLLAPLLAACTASPRAHPSSPAPLVRLFGPVISDQVVRGREEDGDVVTLLVDRTIVHVDLKAQRSWTAAIGIGTGETCWGLARLTDGSLWTLKGRQAVIRIEPDGQVSRVIELSEPHAGLFAAGDRLVYQRAVSAAAEPALRSGDQAMWSELRVRSFPGIERAQAAALNLVACGRSRVPERACWFPDEAAVVVSAPDGRTRRVALAGLKTVAPEVLLTSENPKRPVRDAYIDERRRIWILSTGEAPAGSEDRAGGWLLARYAADGRPDGQAQLAEPVRLILRVDASRVVVLGSSGHVSQVASW